MNACPACGRKLLSHISSSCNWCGVEIRDADYLARADVERAAVQAEQAQHSWQSFTIMQGGGPGFVSPPFRRLISLPHRASQEAPPEPQTEEPVDETKARFGHLEI